MNLRKVLIVLVGLPIGLWLVLEVIARSYMAHTLASGWPTPSGRLAAVVDLFPPQPSNDAAHALEQEAWPLGIDIYPRVGPKRDAALGTSGERWKSIDKPLGTYVRTTLQQERATPAMPPAQVAAFLTENESAIDGLARVLIAKEPPVWRVEVGSGFDAPLPNLLGNLQLVRLLVASSLRHAGRNQSGPAWRDLQAASRLPKGLFSRPEPMSQLIAIAEASLIVGTMRQLPGPPPPWALTWPEEDLPRRLNRAFAVDAWHGLSPFASTRMIDFFTLFAGKDARPSLLTRAISLILSPYLRLSAANAAAAYRTALRHNLEPPACDQSVQGLTATGMIPKWNVFGRVAVPVEVMSSSHQRMRSLNAHTEGTRILLHARFARQQGGTWPPALPPIASPCAQRMWSYAASPFHMEIHANVKIPPIETPKALNLATRFEE